MSRSQSFDDSPEAKRRQRLNTLLPILRNVLMVMIVGIAVLMALDALGVQIGPLLAGAGVVGIAIGFGAQTLVKDIISGMFYLLDDAFRVGEYIQSGEPQGHGRELLAALGQAAPPSRADHHRALRRTRRGPEPEPRLGDRQDDDRRDLRHRSRQGAARSSSRSASELAADPEIAPNIIEPLKMQGVEQMGEFAVQIRLKMMTKPGEQFAVRRRAYALIKKAFEANGIKFAVPTVQVSGGGR